MNYYIASKSGESYDLSSPFKSYIEAKVCLDNEAVGFSCTMDIVSETDLVKCYFKLKEKQKEEHKKIEDIRIYCEEGECGVSSFFSSGKCCNFCENKNNCDSVCHEVENYKTCKKRLINK